MGFVQPIVIKSIKAIRLSLVEDKHIDHVFHPPEGQNPGYWEDVEITDHYANYELELLDANGNMVRPGFETGDLVPHLTPEQVAWLLQFIADIRTLAEAEIIIP